MSNDRAIAAVTATLRNMLFQAVSGDADLAGTTVTTRPPDRARQDGTTSNQINLFLYRTSIDAAWRNQDPPGIRPGESGQPPLPLVLSYLMTAYGEDDDEVLADSALWGADLNALPGFAQAVKNNLASLIETGVIKTIQIHQTKKVLA